MRKKLTVVHILHSPDLQLQPTHSNIIMKLSTKLTVAVIVLTSLSIIGGMSGFYRLATSVEVYPRQIAAEYQLQEDMATLTLALTTQVLEWKSLMLSSQDAKERERHWILFEYQEFVVRSMTRTLGKTLPENSVEAVKLRKSLFTYDALVMDYRAYYDEFKAGNYSLERLENATRGLEKPVTDQMEDVRRVLTKRSKHHLQSTTYDWIYSVFTNLIWFTVAILLGVFGEPVFRWFARKAVQKEIETSTDYGMFEDTKR